MGKDRAGKEGFCPRDVSKCLGIDNSRQLKQRLTSLGVTEYTPTMQRGAGPAKGNTAYIYEAKLYRCIYQGERALTSSSNYFLSASALHPKILLALSIPFIYLTL